MLVVVGVSSTEKAMRCDPEERMPVKNGWADACITLPSTQKQPSSREQSVFHTSASHHQHHHGGGLFAFAG